MTGFQSTDQYGKWERVTLRWRNLASSTLDRWCGLTSSVMNYIVVMPSCIFVLQLWSVFLKNLKAIPLKCNLRKDRASEACLFVAHIARLISIYTDQSFGIFPFPNFSQVGPSPLPHSPFKMPSPSSQIQVEFSSCWALTAVVHYWLKSALSL